MDALFSARPNTRWASCLPGNFWLETTVQVKKSDKIFVAGHRGMVGSAFMRRLEAEGFTNLLKPQRFQLDLMKEDAVLQFFLKESPDIVILAAAKVGGIKANNDYPVEFLLENLRIQNNVIRSASQSGVRKLLFLGSSCIYPKLAPQPIPESALLTGPLEPTNEAYAIAKIAGIKLCQAYARQKGKNFISVMPTNLYGPNDDFDLETSHVLAAIVRKAHEAKAQKEKQLIVWGTGKPRREFPVPHTINCFSFCAFASCALRTIAASTCDVSRSKSSLGPYRLVGMTEMKFFPFWRAY